MNPSSSQTILVTDGEQRSALAAVRSLGRAGHHVIVCSANGQSIAGASRFAAADYAVADALAVPEQFVHDLQRIARDEHVTVIIPVTEPAVLAILPARNGFGDATIPFADLETFRCISDKEAVLAAAQHVGIAAPKQHVLRTPQEASEAFRDTVQFPLVIKPARSVSEGAHGRMKLSVMHVATRDEFDRALQALDPGAYPLLIQQRIVGPGVGIFVLRWHGQTLAAFSHRRIREKPPSGGVSVYRESIVLDEVLLEQACALLDTFSWHGVAMIEFKVDARTNAPYLMEINGRFWGSLQLAIDAGVDFPRLLVDAAVGHTVTPVVTYDTHVRSRWFFGEVDHLIARLRRSDRALALPPGAPGRFKTLLAFFRRHPNDRDEMHQPDDPAPFRRERALYIADLLGR